MWKRMNDQVLRSTALIFRPVYVHIAVDLVNETNS